MKDLVNRAKSFLIFDAPLRNRRICELFSRIHYRYQEQFPFWSLAATRKKVIADFWFRQVLFHFGVILSVTMLVSMVFYRNWHLPLISVFVAGFVSLLAITVFNYWPTYYSDFLPKLDTIIAEQEKNIIAAGEIKKCKRSQFSIPALTIIFYVFSKAGKIPLPACNDRSAELLNHLYGSDKDKLKQNLSRLYKLNGLSPKERAEILKGIDCSRAFFEALDFPPAENILDILEQKLQRA
jgi:hypothetical protein